MHTLDNGAIRRPTATALVVLALAAGRDTEVCAYQRCYTLFASTASSKLPRRSREHQSYSAGGSGCRVSVLAAGRRLFTAPDRGLRAESARPISRIGWYLSSLLHTSLAGHVFDVIARLRLFGLFVASASYLCRWRFGGGLLL
jgi:hypothetical protein